MVMESLGNSVAGYGQMLHRIFIRLRYGDPVPGDFYETGGSARSTRRMAEPPAVVPFVHYEPNPRSRSYRYLARISDLCRARGVQLIAVEIPTYGDPPISSARRSSLEDVGATVVSYPQVTELFVPESWFDQRHMNVWGSRVFTEAFIEELQALAIN
jgi:hypothetical protein